MAKAWLAGELLRKAKAFDLRAWNGTKNNEPRQKVCRSPLFFYFCKKLVVNTDFAVRAFDYAK